MSSKKVLHIGLPNHPFDPSISDSQVQATVQAGADRATAAGYIIQLTFLDFRNSSDPIPSFKKTLSTGNWEALIIGGGLRMSPNLTAQFEAIVNFARETRPGTKILFQAAPGDILETLERGFRD